jgi:hypothetical protein
VQVDYDIALDEKATVPLPFAFWFHNYVGTRAATPGQAKSRRSTFYVPEDYGIRKLHWPTEKRSDAWFNNTVRGWPAWPTADRTSAWSSDSTTDT